MWTYFGVDVFPHGPNSMGLRWIATNPRADGPPYLRADSKTSMRRLIWAATA